MVLSLPLLSSASWSIYIIIRRDGEVIIFVDPLRYGTVLVSRRNPFSSLVPILAVLMHIKKGRNLLTQRLSYFVYSLPLLNSHRATPFELGR